MTAHQENSKLSLRPGQILTGPLFNEPMRVETVRANGPDSFVAGLVGTHSERFRNVTLTERDLLTLSVQDSIATYDGDSKLLHLGLQAYSLGLAYEFDPYFGLSISRVDPLPHQLEAVYEHLLKLSRVRFLLADDAGAGKTIMAGLLIRELKLRGLAERILIIGPANLTFQWQRELKEKFDEKFLVLKGGEIRDQFGVNQWMEQKQILTSLDLAKRSEILPGLRQVHWDLVIVDEAHRMSWSPSSRKTARYALGELLRDTSDHILLLTATPHKGDPDNFTLFPLKPVANLPHTFDPGKTPTVLRTYESESDWKLPTLSAKYPRSSTEREIAEKHNLEWITPGHPLFEAVRRHTLKAASESFGKGACFYSLQHDAPARLDFYRAQVVDGLGRVTHERLFALEFAANSPPRLQEPGLVGNFTVASPPEPLPPIATASENADWLNEHALMPFLEEVRTERVEEVERIKTHVELSLTELLQKADEELGRAATEVEKKVAGAEGRLVQTEARHSELTARRDRRRRELEQEQSLSLQGVQRIASVLILPHPEREAPEVRNLRPNFETEATAMRVVIEHEEAQGRQVYDVHEKNLGYDITSLDLNSGELRLIEVKGIGAESGTVMLSPNERRVAEDRRDCYWLYVVTHCNAEPRLRDPIKDPARFPWHEVTKVAHYYLSVEEMAPTRRGQP